jgi:dipeptidyl aminopeptidase/acylaminoacyl peptidase
MLRNRITRLIPILLVIVLFLSGAVYFGGGYYVYTTLTAVQPRCESRTHEDNLNNTPAGFHAAVYQTGEIIDDTPYRMPDYQTITFPSRDDAVEIAAWYIPASQESDQVVIVVHGIHACRLDPTVLLPAGMLHMDGFNVLMIDLRNHGDSEIVDGRTAVGSREYRDVLGAFDYLLAQGFAPEKIGLLGMSLGAGTSVIAFGEEPRIAALWSDSGFADIDETVQDEITRNNYPVFLADAGLNVAALMGINPREHSPLEEIMRHNERPIMITHGDIDTRLKVDFAYDLYEAAGPNAQLWIVEGMEHVQAVYSERDEYRTRLVEFFRSALGS